MYKVLAPLMLFLASAALADSADLAVRFYAVDTPERPGRTSYFNISVENAGPDFARDVVVTVEINGFPLTRQPLGDLGPRKKTTFATNTALPSADGTLTATAEVASSTPDPNAENNADAATVEISSAPWVLVAADGPAWIDPRMPFTLELAVWNGDGFAAAHDVVATVELPDGTGVGSLPPNCSVASETRVDCAVDQVGPTLEVVRFPLQLRAPARTGGETLTFKATVRAREMNFRDRVYPTVATLSRSFVVTTTADGGDGSLRAAIDAANASCPAVGDRCAIIFNIAEPSERPWKTIRVASPLPPLRVPSLHVDGATQAAFSGANPDGPSIEISGGGTVDGDGLAIGGCFQTVANLAINGFRRFAIFSDGNAVPQCFGGTQTITGNYIGVDPAGAAAVPNLRGIATAGKQSTTIESNVISGNVRAGIFASGGDLRILANRIGVAAHADESLPNGASGIYIGPDAGHRTLIERNVIAFNGQMGIAIDRAAQFTGGFGNRIWGNGGLAIDDGLDGPSPSVNTIFGPMEVPAITSATFDPATGETTIRGTASSPRGLSFTTEVFASDAPGPGGAGDAQRLIGRAREPAFELKVKGDLRGQWIAAATTIIDDNLEDFEPSRRTTELSAAVQVR